MKIIESKSTSRRNFIKLVSGGIIGGMALFTLPETSKAKYIISGGDDISPNDEKFWKIVRDQFPLTKERIYMNNGTMGPSPYVVQESMFVKEREVNITGEYAGYEEARPKIAKFINALPEDISFTHNVTQGINVIAQGIKLKSGDEVIITNHEHIGNAMPWFTRAKRDGIIIKIAKLGNNADEVLNNINKTITSKTRVIAVPQITCTQGQILPVKEICKLGHDKGLWVMIDSAHPVGMIPVDVKDMDCDFLATCGHKWMLGPKGTGFLYVKKDMLDVVEPIMTGGGPEHKFDPETGIKEWANSAHRYDFGSLSAAIFVGMGAAVDFLTHIGIKNVAARGKALSTHLMNNIKDIPNVQILTPWEEKSRASITGFKLKNMEFGKFQNWVSEKYKIRVRGVGEGGLNSLRISTHIYNNFDEVDVLIKAVKEAAEK
jgi:selenocysteine lyase/cysteine desulfurase